MAHSMISADATAVSANFVIPQPGLIPNPSIEELLYVYLVGPRDRIASTINQLQVLEYCQRVRWSPIVPILGTDGLFISFVKR